MADAGYTRDDLAATIRARNIEIEQLRTALANMLEDGDKTDREEAMKLLGWDTSLSSQNPSDNPRTIGKAGNND